MRILDCLRISQYLEYQIPNIKYQISNMESQISNTKYQISNISVA